MKLLALLTALAIVASAPAQEPGAQVRASIHSDPEPPWIGQKVVLKIDLLAPGYFASAPRFAFPRIPGVLLIPPEGHPVLGSEQIGDQSYTVQSYEALLIAEREGAHEIPSFPIRFDIKRFPLDPQGVSQEVATPGFSFSARRPPGTQGLPFLVSSRSFSAQETWEPGTANGKAGDAFTRTIAFTASDLPGIAFPPFSAPPVDGIGVYPGKPVIDAEAGREGLSGSRVESIVYVCERPGRFVVPAATLAWWSLDDQTLHTVVFPEHVLNVARNPALPGASLGGLYQRLFHSGMAAAGLLLAGGAAWLFIPWTLCASACRCLRPTHLGPLNPMRGKGTTT